MLKKTLIFVCFFTVLTTNLYALIPWSGLSNTTPFNTGKKYFMYSGFCFDAVLKTAIFSFNLLTPVIAETEFDAICLDRIMIPKGTKIIGYASICKTDDRVQVFSIPLYFLMAQN